MKVEQQQVEGVDGVLAAMKEHAHNAGTSVCSRWIVVHICATSNTTQPFLALGWFFFGFF